MQKNTCPLRDQYHFKQHCTIKTCKFYTESTKHHCLGLDIRFSAGDKVTDAELKLHKFPELSLQKIAQVRKAAIARTENILKLYGLLLRIENEPQDWQYEPSPIIDTFLMRKPLRIKKLGFEPWMLYYLCDREYVLKHTGIEPHVLLWISESEYLTIVNIVRSTT